MLNSKRDYELQYEEYAELIRTMIVTYQGCVGSTMVPTAECARDALKLHPYYLAHEKGIAADANKKALALPGTSLS